MELCILIVLLQVILEMQKYFLNGINSSIAIHNVSTQFADGGEFGFGGKLSISTNKLPQEVLLG